jgi:hypothetical protein
MLNDDQRFRPGIDRVAVDQLPIWDGTVVIALRTVEGKLQAFHARLYALGQGHSPSVGVSGGEWREVPSASSGQEGA